MSFQGFPGVAQWQKNPVDNVGDTGDAGLIPGFRRSPAVGSGSPLSILAGKIAWSEEPGGLQSKESNMTGHARTCPLDESR